MNVQVLVASMNQCDHSLLDKMNIQTDAIVGNQCNINFIEEFEYKGRKIKYLNFNERGVGLNRNNALMRATGSICLFADDDMRFVDGYEEKVKLAFEQNPKADVIVFNLIEENSRRYINKKVKKIGKLNYLRYGAARIAIKTSAVKKNGIYFNQCFGGGTEHSSGEDSIFLASCLQKKLKIYAHPFFIAEMLGDRESSWFKGYNEKYFLDKGCLYKTISSRYWKLLCLQDAVRHKNMYGNGWIKTYKTMIKGGKERVYE